MGTAAWALRNREPVSASEAEAATLRSVLVAKDMDGAIGCGVLGKRACCQRKISEQKVAGSTAAGIGENKVSGIRADGKDHVASVVPDGGIRMGGKLVKEHVAGSLGFFGRRCLVVGDFVEGGDDRGITAAGVVQPRRVRKFAE